MESSILFSKRSWFFGMAVLVSHLTLYFAPLQASESNQYLSYSGKIINPKGQALESSQVQAIVSIYSSGSEKCLLFQEQHNLNMSNSKGVFALQIGAGARLDNGTHAFMKSFTNAGTLSNLSCASGSSYTPANGEDRLLEVQFSENSSPAGTVSMRIKSIPFAMQAQEISGYGIMNLAKISGSGSASTISSGAWNKIVSLGEGSSDLDLNGKKLTNIGTPSVSTDAASKGYVDTQFSSLTGSMVLDVTAGTNISVSGTASHPIVSLNVPNASGVSSGLLSSSDWLIFNSKLGRCCT